MILVDIIFCEKDRSGALCCFFCNKSESVEPDPIGFRPKLLINFTSGTIADIHKKLKSVGKFKVIFIWL